MIRKLRMMAVWISPIVKDRLNEERNEVKISRSVLESSGSCKGVADFTRSPVNACPLISHLPELRDKPNYYSQKKYLPGLKKEPVKVEWSGEELDFSRVPANTLQEVCKRVDIA